MHIATIGKCFQTVHAKESSVEHAALPAGYKAHFTKPPNNLGLHFLHFLGFSLTLAFPKGYKGLHVLLGRDTPRLYHILSSCDLNFNPSRKIRPILYVPLMLFTYNYIHSCSHNYA